MDFVRLCCMIPLVHPSAYDSCDLSVMGKHLSPQQCGMQHGEIMQHKLLQAIIPKMTKTLYILAMYCFIPSIYTIYRPKTALE